MAKTSIRFFEDIPVRAVWDEERTKGGFLIIVHKKLTNMDELDG